MPKLKDPEIQREVTSRVINAIERLIELGLVKNQKEFCKLSGYKEANLSKIMNGERFAPLMLVHFLSFSFNISPTWILLGKGPVFNLYKKSDPSFRITLFTHFTGFSTCRPDKTVQRNNSPSRSRKDCRWAAVGWGMNCD